ncbi:hypothetical protein HNQ94_002343 [Salirhabdus euzebyi]|uniref:YwdI family protein n=1 Tax=Salirhabdus euzebyi TaxID=394506 RepID=A0A841Q6G2_9BACI|nr:YwdI family protein [Salirhabdus euzebyi]MBB6453892.1 hypothetical protein [Salirhabdus euzebyi]
MPISDNKVLTKMMEEMHKAQQVQHDPSKMKEHIRAIKLLTELMLDNESTTNEDVVLKKMSQQQMLEKKGSYERNDHHEKPSIEHDGANGDSIFDF